MKKIIPIVAVIFSLVSVSCPWPYEDIWLLEITNFPDWIMMNGASDSRDSGFSPWMNWQKGTHPIAVLLSPQQKADKKEFDGFFSVRHSTYDILYAWNGWKILFSDGSGCSLIPWLGKSDFSNSKIKIPQSDPNVFEFDAQLHNDDYGYIRGSSFDRTGVSPYEEPVVMVKIRYEFIEKTEESYRYRFILTLDNGSVLIDTEIEVLRDPWFSDNDTIDWLPISNFDIKIDDSGFPYRYEIDRNYEFDPDFERTYGYYISGQITKTNPYTALRQEEIDHDERRVLYSVYGASPDSNLHYIEVHSNTQSTVVFRFMNKDKEILEEGTGWLSRQEDLDTW